MTSLFASKLTRNSYSKRWCCMFCGKNTERIRENYILRDNLWWKLTSNWNAGNLCLQCIEKKIDRNLTWRDFYIHPGLIPIWKKKKHSHYSKDVVTKSRGMKYRTLKLPTSETENRKCKKICTTRIE